MTTSSVGSILEIVRSSPKGTAGTIYEADAVILATGARAKWLGLESETKFRGFGVSACATCDGFFFRGQEIVVVGGGNTAVEEALFLTRFASKVTLIHRRDELRAEKILQDRLFKNDKIVPLWFHVLDEVKGTEDPMRAVTGIVARHVETGATHEIPCTGVFIAIGHEPASELVREQLETHMGGYVVTAPDSTATAIPACLLQATSRIMPTARPSPPRAWDAWQRWKRSDSLRAKSRRLSLCSATEPVSGIS